MIADETIPQCSIVVIELSLNNKSFERANQRDYVLFMLPIGRVCNIGINYSLGFSMNKDPKFASLICFYIIIIIIIQKTTEGNFLIISVITMNDES